MIESNWASYDFKGGWVATFILLILWWLTYLLKSLVGSKSKGSDGSGAGEEKLEDGTTMATIGATHTGGWKSRTNAVSKHFRDGLLFLASSLLIAFVAAAPSGATVALSWIFVAFWIIIGILQMFIRTPRVMDLLRFLDLILLIALISNAFANAVARSALISAPGT